MIEETLRIESVLSAAGAFKDWSNYLLVTTVAALGWVGRGEALERGKSRSVCIWSLSLSVVFGIFTLAMTPTIIEQIKEPVRSFYEIQGRFRVFYAFGEAQPRFTIKWLCWPQHVAFLIGILSFAIGSTLPASAIRRPQS